MNPLLLASALVILSFPSSLFGQQTFHFPTDSATWSVQRYIYNQFPYPEQCIAMHYGYNGDTIIEGMLYSKLLGNNLSGHYYQFNDTEFNPATAVYLAAVRTDTFNKVWVRLPDDTIDFLYYDFSLKTGDTFCFSFPYPSQVGDSCSVVQIDYINVNGQQRKEYEFIWSSDVWIEGIGSIAGWLRMPEVGSIAYNLLCFKERNVLVYPVWSYCHCDTYFTFIEEPEPGEVRIHPNPATSTVRVEAPGNANSLLTLYTLTGHKVKEVLLTGKATDLDVSGLPNGMYLVMVQDHGSGGLRVGKLVVER